MNNKLWVAHALAALAFLLFGSTSLIVKPSSLSIVDLVWSRMFLAGAGALLLALMTGTFSLRTLNRRNGLSAALVATAIFLNMLCLFSSFRLAPVSLCAALFYTGPILTLVLRRRLDLETLGRYDRLAIGIAVAAIATLFLDGALGNVTPTLLKGYGLALLGGILFGLVPIFERGCSGIPPTFALCVQSVFASVVLAPFTGLSLAVLPQWEVRGLLILGLGFTFLPFLLWWKSLRLHQGVSPFVVYIDPLTATAISFFIFRENLNPPQIVATLGLALCAFIHIALSPKHPETAIELAGVTPE